MFELLQMLRGEYVIHVSELRVKLIVRSADVISCAVSNIALETGDGVAFNSEMNFL